MFCKFNQLRPVMFPSREKILRTNISKDMLIIFIHLKNEIFYNVNYTYIHKCSLLNNSYLCNKSLHVATYQGHLNQKATLIRPFQFSIFPYKLCFCDISGGRTFLRSIYRFRTQSIETFPLFILRLSA
jgi:hypothetical protein